jgi:enoyl-CoA hydratase
MHQAIKYERSGAIATITMNRPETLNALTVEIIEAFSDALTAASEDPGVRVLVLAGTGRAFCVGADIKQLKLWRADPDIRKRFAIGASRMFEQLLHFPRPIVAAVNGVAAAGGFELCCCAELIVAAEDAMIGDAHANFVGFGPLSSVLAPLALPPKLAAELLLTGDMWPAAKLAAIGFVNHVVSRERVLPFAREIAEKIASKQPLALAAARGLMRQAIGADPALLLPAAFAQAERIFESADFAEGVAAFEEKRTPRFEGR